MKKPRSNAPALKKDRLESEKITVIAEPVLTAPISVIDNIVEEKLNQQRFAYLEQIRDFTYKDVVLADTKAGFALTIVGASLAAYVALIDKFSQVKPPWISYVHLFGASGLIFGGLSVLCAMLTILPRAYISHEIISNPDHWIHLRAGWRPEFTRRVGDAFSVLFENVWQKQTKGTSQSLDMLMKNTADQRMMTEVLYVSMQRAVMVQNLKYLWAGKSILFAFLAFILISISFLFGIAPILLANKIGRF
jgi:hypothetical protein